ncbi:DUF7848 domain-containing protein [Streptomyces hygroscopicus]
MTRTILKGSDLALSAERGQGAPDGIYLAECTTCPATSGRVDSDPGPVARWAILHWRGASTAHVGASLPIRRRGAEGSPSHAAPAYHPHPHAPAPG